MVKQRCSSHAIGKQGEKEREREREREREGTVIPLLKDAPPVTYFLRLGSISFLTPIIMPSNYESIVRIIYSQGQSPCDPITSSKPHF
jgi:hypothetical protein